MLENFQLLSEIENRPLTRATANYFFPPRVYNNGTNTFYFTGIGDWNALPTEVKEIKNELIFKEKLKQTLMAKVKNVEGDQFKRS